MRKLPLDLEDYYRAEMASRPMPNDWGYLDVKLEFLSDNFFTKYSKPIAVQVLTNYLINGTVVNQFEGKKQVLPKSSKNVSDRSNFYFARSITVFLIQVASP